MVLTSNVNLEDRLMNSLIGKVMTFKFIGSHVNVIHIKFNDGNAEKVTKHQDHLARQNN